jgi:DNA-binding transcriptional MocR family regulator
MSNIQMQQVVVAPGVIDLGVGQPSSDLLPEELLRRGFGSHPDRPDILQYGAEWGDGEYRIALAGFLSRHYGIAVEPTELLATNGNSQALDMVCARLAGPGDVVFVEDPTYFLALQTFRDHRLDVRPIAVDDEGMCVDQLRAGISTARSEGQRIGFVHTIPAFHNPTSVTLSDSRRAELLATAMEMDVVVVADEVYHLLDYGIAPDAVPARRPMSAAVHDAPVLSLGTFSKILAPGLRLGWAHAAPSLLERLAGFGVIASGGGLSPVTGHLATMAITSGFADAHLARVRGELAGRASLMTSLAATLPGVSFRPVSGGYFVWLQLDSAVDPAAVIAACHAHKIGLRHGPLFDPTGSGRHAAALRLSFAFYRAGDITDGMGRLAAALESVVR